MTNPALEDHVGVQQVPVIHGDPMTPERLKEFMDQIRLMETDAKISPRARFVDSARVAGFSDSQAEFLWQLHIMPPPRLF